MSLIRQLQAEALDPEANITDVLRKALVAATKLDVRETRRWIAQELNGYESPLESVPNYRRIRGRIKGLCPYRGWVPVQFPNTEFENMASTWPIAQSISEIKHLVEASAPFIALPIPADHQQLLRQMFQQNFLFEAHFNHSTLIGILDAVRTKVLDWSLDLEKAGIVGEGLSFSSKEKNMAQSITVNGNVGVLGNATGPANVFATGGNVFQAVSGEMIGRLVAKIRTNIPKESRSENTLLEKSLAELEKEAEQHQPDASRVRSALARVKLGAAQLGNAFVEAGVKALVDRALDN